MTPTGQGTLQIRSQHPTREAMRAWETVLQFLVMNSHSLPTEKYLPAYSVPLRAALRNTCSPPTPRHDREVDFIEPGKVFSGGGEQQLVTCQAAMARPAQRLGSCLIPRGGKLIRFLVITCTDNKQSLGDRQCGG